MLDTFRNSLEFLAYAAKCVGISPDVRFKTVDDKNRVSPSPAFGVFESALSLAQLSPRYFLIARALLRKIDDPSENFCASPAPERLSLAKIKYLLMRRKMEDALTYFYSLPPAQITANIISSLVSKLTPLRESFLQTKNSTLKDQRERIEKLETFWRNENTRAWTERDYGQYAAFIQAYRNLRDYDKMRSLLTGLII
jgi:hypothetical protein